LELNRTYHLLAYDDDDDDDDDDVNILYKNINTTNRSTEALSEAGWRIRLEVNTDKTCFATKIIV